MKPFHKFITSVLVVGCQVGVAQAASEELARKGSVAWRAFECVYLARTLNNQRDAERLFAYGIDSGRVFIEAIKANKISKDELNETVPVGVLWNLEGPTTDFMLGKIFQDANDNTDDEIKRLMGDSLADDLRNLIARDLYSKYACDIIGRD